MEIPLGGETTRLKSTKNFLFSLIKRSVGYLNFPPFSSQNSRLISNKQLTKITSQQKIDLIVQKIPKLETDFHNLNWSKCCSWHQDQHTQTYANLMFISSSNHQHKESLKSSSFFHSPSLFFSFCRNKRAPTTLFASLSFFFLSFFFFILSLVNQVPRMWGGIQWFSPLNSHGDIL